MTPDSPDAPAETSPPAQEVDLRNGQNSGQGDLIVAGGNVFITIYRSFFATTAQRVVVLLFLTVAVALAGSIYWLTQQPWPLRGDFNIAVAEFREMKEGKAEVTQDSEQIGLALFSFLDGEYKRTNFGLRVAVGRRNMGYIDGSREAAKLARQVDANLVVFGTLFGEDAQIELQPRFFVVSQIQRRTGGKAEIGSDVDEVLGAYPFTLTLTDTVESNLKTQAAVLSSFTQGLIRLHSNDLKPALAAFETASREAENLQGFEGLEALYLFTAVANRRLGNYETASAALDQAFAANENYGRAMIARGNIYYSLAVDGFEAIDGCLITRLDPEVERLCQEERNEDAWWSLLAKAESIYKRASEAKQQPYSFYLEEKAWLGVGNVRLLAAQQGEDLFGAYGQAGAAYQRVADSYAQTPDEAKQDLAASAHWGLGVTNDRQGNTNDAEEAYRMCIEVAHYDREIKEECKNMLAELKVRETEP